MSDGCIGGGQTESYCLLLLLLVLTGLINFTAKLQDRIYQLEVDEMLSKALFSSECLLISVEC